MNDLPNPEILMRLAEEEDDRVPLQDYGLVIVKLRDEKHFSYRAITDWLNQHGVSTNQSAVYRAYTRQSGMTEADIAADAKEPDEFDEAP